MTPDVERFVGTGEEWDAFVTGAAGWSHFHYLGWKLVIERAFGHECPYLACRRPDGRLRGVLPLVRVRSRLFGHYLVSMPFLNYGGPLGDVDAIRALTAAAAELARGSGAKLLELRSRHELDVDLPASHRKITVLLDLPEKDEALWKSFPAKVRSQVRRPQKEGVTVRFGPAEVGPFYQVFARHMRDLGTPALPRRLFEIIAHQFGDSVWFGCAYRAAEPVAAGCGFRWGSEFEMTWASALRAHSRIAPNMLLYWRFMQRCVTEGLTLFNFGRCTPEGGTHRFKRQWGSRDEQLWWYQDGPGAAVGTPSPDRGAYAWGPRVWKHLPLPVANLIGPRLVQYIP